MAAEGGSRGMLNHDKRAEAVVLDFVNPAAAFWRLFYGNRKLGGMKPTLQKRDMAQQNASQSNGGSSGGIERGSLTRLRAVF